MMLNHSLALVTPMTTATHNSLVASTGEISALEASKITEALPGPAGPVSLALASGITALRPVQARRSLRAAAPRIRRSAPRLAVSLEAASIPSH